MLFRADMNSLDNSSCFLFYIRGVSQNILLQTVKSIRITKIENKVDFLPFPFVPYSDVGTYNCANTFLGSDSANLKLSKCDNHGNLNRSSRSQEFTL